MRWPGEGVRSRRVLAEDPRALWQPRPGVHERNAPGGKDCMNVPPAVIHDLGIEKKRSAA
jgi:hypothetical protein